MKSASIRLFLLAVGSAHTAFGVMGLALPRWFYGAVPPWPPLHVGQIQIAGIFDLSLGALFLFAARDVARYAPLAAMVGVIAEWGHAGVRIGHVIAGDNPSADLFLPSVMLLMGAAFVVIALTQGRADH